MANKHTAYILLGGNVGDRKSNLAKAKMDIEKHCGNIIAQSSIYQTAAWGLKEQPDFLNEVIAIETSLLPDKLMLQLLQIEESLGRVRTIKLGPRTIDLDILLIDQLIINSTLLTVPHPALPNRKFALIPLAEIAPTLIHPVEKCSISALLKACSDDSNVQKITINA